MLPPAAAASPTPKEEVLALRARLARFLQGREMFWSVLLPTMWGLATAVIDSDLDQHWFLWKKLHSKVYSHQVGVGQFGAAARRTCLVVQWGSKSLMEQC